jgi:hypothetical protein
MSASEHNLDLPEAPDAGVRLRVVAQFKNLSPRELRVRALQLLEPIRKELESVESVVIHCAAPFVRKEGAGCGRRNIVEFTLARVCAIRAI